MSRPGLLRVLVVSARVPWPLHHGGRLRLHHFLRGIAPLAQITLTPTCSALNAECVPPGVRVESPLPLSADHTAFANCQRGSRRLERARRFVGYDERLGAWLRTFATPAKFDVALVSGTTIAAYVPDLRVPVVWDPVDDPVLYVLRDAGARVWRWPAALKAALAFGLLGKTVAKHASAVVLSSSVDASAAKRWARPTPTVVIPNGVDLDCFQPNPGPGESGTVVFVGSLSFPPNVDAIVRFTRRIWPRLLRRGVARRLVIVGKKPVEAVLALRDMPGVELAPDVPDVRPYLARAAAVIAPTLRGAGIKNKILEACAAQRPVVASHVATAGLSARPGTHILVANRPRQWIEMIEALLTQPARASSLALSGREWVEAAHCWADCGRALLSVLQTASEQSQSRAHTEPRSLHATHATPLEAACR